MKGPPLDPGGEDITWPDQVAPRGRKASSTRSLKPQTSNLIRDGHGSHMTYDFLFLCREMGDVLVLPPPYTTAALQGEDRRNFQLVKGGWRLARHKKLAELIVKGKYRMGFTPFAIVCVLRGKRAFQLPIIIGHRIPLVWSLLPVRCVGSSWGRNGHGIKHVPKLILMHLR